MSHNGDAVERSHRCCVLAFFYFFNVRLSTIFLVFVPSSAICFDGRRKLLATSILQMKKNGRFFIYLLLF